MKWYRDRNVVITGAASGIGRLMARYCADAGSNVALVDINVNLLSDVEKEIRNKDIIVKTYACDISSREDAKKTCQKIKDHFHHIDVLINNAGVVNGKDFLDLSVEDFERTMNVNFWGHVHFTMEFLPQMIERMKGNIVNIASSGGLLGMPLLSDYCASKFAEVGFSESLKSELRKKGLRNVKVTCVCPYIIDTGMFRGFKPFFLHPFVKADKAVRNLLKATAKGRFRVLIPFFSIKSMLILKLLPDCVFDRIMRIFGAEKAMDSFQGR